MAKKKTAGKRAGRRTTAKSGRITLRREDAAYRASVDERRDTLRANIDAAVESGVRLREEIEKRIERRLQEAGNDADLRVRANPGNADRGDRELRMGRDRGPLSWLRS
jgi:hypothetical protein